MEAKNWTKRQHANGFAIVNGDFNSDDVVAHGVSEERADMILRACNAHDDLVKAAKDALRYVEKELLQLHAKMATLSESAVKVYEESPVYQGLLTKRDAIRAAIAKANGV